MPQVTRLARALQDDKPATYAPLDADIAAGGIHVVVDADRYRLESFLNLLAGYRTPLHGKLTSTTALPPHDVWYIRSASDLMLDMSVESAIRLYSSLRPAFNAVQARELCHEFGIGLRRRPMQLNGSQRAQLAVLLGIASGAALLILDPTMVDQLGVSATRLCETLRAQVSCTPRTVLIGMSVRPNAAEWEAPSLRAIIEHVATHVLVLGASGVLVNAALREAPGDGTTGASARHAVDELQRHLPAALRGVTPPVDAVAHPQPNPRPQPASAAEPPRALAQPGGPAAVRLGPLLRSRVGGRTVPLLLLGWLLAGALVLWQLVAASPTLGGAWVLQGMLNVFPWVAMMHAAVVVTSCAIPWRVAGVRAVDIPRALGATMAALGVIHLVGFAAVLVAARQFDVLQGGGEAVVLSLRLCAQWLAGASGGMLWVAAITTARLSPELRRLRWWCVVALATVLVAVNGFAPLAQGTRTVGVSLNGWDGLLLALIVCSFAVAWHMLTHPDCPPPRFAFRLGGGSQPKRSWRLGD